MKLSIITVIEKQLPNLFDLYQVPIDRRDGSIVISNDALIQVHVATEKEIMKLSFTENGKYIETKKWVPKFFNWEVV